MDKPSKEECLPEWSCAEVNEKLALRRFERCFWFFFPPPPPFFFLSSMMSEGKLLGRTGLIEACDSILDFRLTELARPEGEGVSINEKLNNDYSNTSTSVRIAFVENLFTNVPSQRLVSTTHNRSVFSATHVS